MKCITISKINFILIGLVIFCSCKEEEVFENFKPNTELGFNDSSALNPNRDLYQDVLNKAVKKGVPGAILLVYTPQEGLWVGAAGKSCIETQTAMTPANTLFSASIGKTYCAVAIMKLVEEGKIDLDAKMNKYLPSEVCEGITNGNKITIHQLLSMQSGIINFDNENTYMCEIINDPSGIKRYDAIRMMYNKKASFFPGTSVEYSSTNYELLAMVIDKVTGRKHENYYESEIIKPIELDNTYYKNDFDYPTPNGLVNAYVDITGDGRIVNFTKQTVEICKSLTGSDGIIATIYDYYKFYNALFNENLVSESSLNQMTQFSNYPGKKDGYGLGIERKETDFGFLIGHSGGQPGVYIEMFYSPEYHVFIGVYSNIGTSFLGPIRNSANKLWADALEVVFRNI